MKELKAYVVSREKLNNFTIFVRLENWRTQWNGKRIGFEILINSQVVMQYYCG